MRRPGGGVAWLERTWGKDRAVSGSGGVTTWAGWGRGGGAELAKAVSVTDPPSGSSGLY